MPSRRHAVGEKGFSAMTIRVLTRRAVAIALGAFDARPDRRAGAGARARIPRRAGGRRPLALQRRRPDRRLGGGIACRPRSRRRSGRITRRATATARRSSSGLRRSISARARRHRVLGVLHGHDRGRSGRAAARVAASSPRRRCGRSPPISPRPSIRRFWRNRTKIADRTAGAGLRRLGSAAARALMPTRAFAARPRFSRG